MLRKNLNCSQQKNTATRLGLKAFGFFRAAAIVWTITIALLCGLPGGTLPDISLNTLLEFDTLAHAFVFMIFGLLWSIVLHNRPDHLWLHRNAGWFIAVAGIVYGILLEFAQFYIFVRRTAEWPDMVADAFGALLGWGLFVVYKNLKLES